MGNSPKDSASRFSPQVEGALRRAGWHPARTASATQLEQWLVIEWPTTPSHHFQTRMFSAAWHILREFGGLTVTLPVINHSCNFLFNPVEAVARTSAYNWPVLEWEADGSFYPIGYLDFGTTENSAIAVDGQGRIIMVEFDKLLGSNIDEALQNITNGSFHKEWKVDEGKTREAADVFPLMRARLGL